MWSAAVVLVCALDLLGRSAASFPPIVLLETRPPGTSDQAEAFVRRGDSTIYLLTSSWTFANAQRSRDKCGALDDVRRLASILVHEEWHVRHGPDERRAYEAQLTALTGMSAGPGNIVYSDVRRSMAVVVKRQSQAPRWGPMVFADRRVEIGADGPGIRFAPPGRLASSIGLRQR